MSQLNLSPPINSLFKMIKVEKASDIDVIVDAFSCLTHSESPEALVDMSLIEDDAGHVAQAIALLGESQWNALRGHHVLFHT